MTAQLSRIVYRIGSPENYQHHYFTDSKDHADIAKNNGYEVDEYVLAGMDSEPVAESVTCWSCKKVVEVSAIGDCDGYCPNCNSPIDLDDEPYITTPTSSVAVPDEVVESLDLLLNRNYFRRWVKEPRGYVGGSIAVRDLVNVVLFANSCRAAILKAEPVTAAKVPEEWKLVPLDATSAMIDAARRVEEDGYDAMHKAMLAAAPAAPEQEV